DSELHGDEADLLTRRDVVQRVGGGESVVHAQCRRIDRLEESRLSDQWRDPHGAVAVAGAQRGERATGQELRHAATQMARADHACQPCRLPADAGPALYGELTRVE